MFKKKNATISGVILLLLSSVFMPTIVLAETNIDPIVKSSEIQEEGMSLEKIEESKLHNEEPDENITEEISSEEDEIIDSKNDDINKQDTNKQDNQIDTQKVEDNSQSNKKEDQTSVPEQEKSSLEDEEKEINAEEEVFSLEKNREKAMEMMEEDLQARNEAGMQRTRAVPYTTAFINSVANAAVQNGKTYGLYPSVIIAQSILESGWGKSKLSGPPNNNLFGIKAEKGYKGPYVAVSTKEWVKDSHYEAGGYYITIIANFRKYSSYNETFKDHAEFLKHKRYTNVWIENADTDGDYGKPSFYDVLSSY
ncbi:glycoside hydrolase family 73 protein [Pisciglobus halotolerans]|uniref:Mannosyl-glycoprotein endo-beta-N-acetylglucosaminidase n=1 Tax=Pisciglobus halotolerans TaxID=745365 RepID=A0A1I3DJ44_9LACT|nr:glucosaminidase domain-containing protein [Pisciglobus halotolerans]SFH86764.1 Mannosyl-glycoprotein endo-beta-N-acetylglucosaminidase [Pisciglobus halotolerans]